jgi:ABC-2 type transport system ATP-binding protein
MATTVRIDALQKRFGSLRAVDGVSLDLTPGITGFLGPNGAGKTTLLRMMATVLAPDGGSIEILGHPTSTSSDREEIRRRLGYLPQEPGFHRSFTAFEFVDYIAILKGLTDRRRRHDEVRRVLTLVGLEAVMHKRIRKLSGGMRRRVGIAQSLVGDPDLLVLDEPTAGLDPEQRLRFREVLTARDEGRTVVLSTHQTDDVAALCQRVVVILGGVVRFDGRPADLTATAVGHVWVAEQRDPSAQLAWAGPDGRVRHIGSPPAGAEPVDPTLEDGYLLLVGAEALRTGDPGGAARAA